MDLYNLNQLGYASLKNMTYNEIEKAEENLKHFLETHEAKYYMLLNHDQRSYTIFTYQNQNSPLLMSHEMIDVAKTFGKIKAIEIGKEMVEFWIQQEKECNMYAMFPYDRGVIVI